MTYPEVSGFVQFETLQSLFLGSGLEPGFEASPQPSPKIIVMAKRAAPAAVLSGFAAFEYICGSFFGIYVGSAA